ncbi:hypothetical protein [Paratractidigestivibacter sp.]|uniref:hypothetical protein n=1 Tax=Paratractidigestivibacter sp. TaxID=2847316 RepID=UPI002AC9BC52|nr:hypothetical protein [Paratractidigestivibacter sp.]
MALRPESDYVKINVRITKRQQEWLKQRTEQFGQSYNWLIRWALSELIGRVEREDREGKDARKQVP